MIRKFGIVFLLICLIIVVTACGKQELKVGIDYNFKPFGYTEAGKRKGFDEDLWQAIAKEAGLTYEIEPMSAGEILESLKEGKLDVGLAGFTISGERKKSVEFATPYFDAGQVILVAFDNQDIESTKQLQGRVIATRLGTTAYQYASKIKGVKEVRAFPDIVEAYEQLTDNQVDAVIFDSPNVFNFVKQDGRGKVKTVGIHLTNEQYGIALKKGSPYLGRVNNALRELGKNGTYEKIYLKWFGHRPTSIPGKK